MEVLFENFGEYTNNNDCSMSRHSIRISCIVFVFTFYNKNTVIMQKEFMKNLTKMIKKMKKLSTLTVLLTIIFIQTGCKKNYPPGPVKTDTRNVGSFNKIALRFDGDVIFTQSAIKSVEVKTAQNIQPLIITEVNGNTLVLKTSPHTKIDKGDVTIYISNPTLAGINLSSNGGFTSETAIHSTAMDIQVSGNGNLKLQALSAGILNTEISGNGSIDIDAGTISTQTVTLSGNGDYKTDNTKSNEAAVKTTGNTSAWVWVSEKLNATITGNGNIWYKGTPAINSSITGSGKVKQL